MIPSDGWKSRVSVRAKTGEGLRGAFEDCVRMKGTEIDVEVEESVDRTPR